MKLLYVRQNLLRKPEYQINTKIIKNGKKTCVIKYIDDDLASKHFKQLIINANLISKTCSKVSIAKVQEVSEKTITYNYIDAPTLEKSIEVLLLNKKFIQTKDQIVLLKQLIHSFKDTKLNPYNNSNFTKWFDPDGKYNRDNQVACLQTGVLDMNFDNVIYNNEKTYLLDTEWVFPFPIPRDFVFFRSLFYLCNKLQPIISTYCNKNFSCYEVIDKFLIPVLWYEQIDLTPDKIEKYLYYESRFQSNILIINHPFKQNLILKDKRLHQKRYSLSLNKLIEYNDKKISELEQEINDFNSKLRFINAIILSTKKILRKIIQKVKN